MRSGWLEAGWPIIFDAVWVILMNLFRSPTESTVRKQMEGRKEKNKVHYTGVVCVVSYVRCCLCTCQSESMMAASQRRLTSAHRCYFYRRHRRHVALESVMIGWTWLSILGKVTKIDRCNDPRLRSWKGVRGGSLLRNASHGSQRTIWHFTINSTYQIRSRRVLPLREQVGKW